MPFRPEPITNGLTPTEQAYIRQANTLERIATATERIAISLAALNNILANQCQPGSRR